MGYEELLERQRAFFEKGDTLRPDFRICALRKLKGAIRRREGELNAALKADLNKAPDESYLTETGMVLSELDFAISHLRGWAAPKRRPTPLSQFPARSRVLPSPYGCTLIISPWNYPFQLALAPLISALAAGNTAVVKPGEDAPATAIFLEDLPAAYLLSLSGRLDLVWFSFPIAELISLTISSICLRHLYKTEIKPLEE